MYDYCKNEPFALVLTYTSVSCSQPKDSNLCIFDIWFEACENIVWSGSGFLSTYILYVLKPGFDTEHVKSRSVCCCGALTMTESQKGFSGCSQARFENWTAASLSATMPICHHITQIYIWKASRTVLRFTSGVQGSHFAFACTQSGGKRSLNHTACEEATGVFFFLFFSALHLRSIYEINLWSATTSLQYEMKCSSIPWKAEKGEI